MRLGSFWPCPHLIQKRQSKLTQLNITQTNQRSASTLTQRTVMTLGSVFNPSCNLLQSRVEVKVATVLLVQSLTLINIVIFQDRS